MKKEKKQEYDTEHLCITRQCVAEYLEKMDVSVEQRCPIKFCVCLKKTPCEITVLLKEASGKETLVDSTIRWWHKAFVDSGEVSRIQTASSAL